MCVYVCVCVCVCVCVWLYSLLSQLSGLWFLLLLRNKHFLNPISQSFSTISLENVAFHVKLTGGASEAEKYIRDMVRHCVLNAH